MLDFPVRILGIHPHLVFDALAFFVGGQLFWRALRRDGGLALTRDAKLTLAAGCIVGAAVGAKLLVLLEDPTFTLAHWRDPGLWVSGKTIVGGLLGGFVGVELAKRSLGIRERTGDNFVVPILVGLAIGRVGCFLSGLEDDTYGTFTSVPWAIDVGDGPRHPAALYEVAFSLALLALLPALRRRLCARGDLFRGTLLAYFTFRFLEEFVRESATPYAGFSVYQLACAAGAAWILADAGLRRRLVHAFRPRTPVGSREAIG